MFIKRAPFFKIKSCSYSNSSKLKAVHGASIRLCLEKSVKIKALQVEVILLFKKFKSLKSWFKMVAVPFKAQADACAMRSFHIEELIRISCSF